MASLRLAPGDGVNLILVLLLIERFSLELEDMKSSFAICLQFLFHLTMLGRIKTAIS